MDIYKNVIKIAPETNPPPSLRSWVIGNRLATADAPHQMIGKVVGLAVFTSDALSSTAYSTQEVLIILVAAGIGAFSYSIPISIAIVCLLIILTISYEQTIHAYPGGGGAYIVARDNLGEMPAQTAGAALLTDYILTVSVSISSGVAQIVSAYPYLFPYRVWIAVGLVTFMMMVNLRGVKESGITFAFPTYYFFLMMIMTIGIGFYKYMNGSLGTVPEPPMDMINNITQPVTLFLVLRAFASGTTALTGVEAISNGITAFKEPRSRNAGITLIWMSFILGAFLLGITTLTHLVGAYPSEEETVFSQVARTVYDGRGFLYLAMISATTIILIMAANTAFADFPRLGALHAGDGFLPRQLTYKGDRLVFSRGIITLSVISSVLIILFQASVTNLIPLYAIGVFLSFTLSQAGMARRWWKGGHLKPGEEVREPGSILRHEKNWETKMVINGFGALCTFVVMIVFAVTKFRDGAWAVIVLTPILVFIFFSIHHHYKGLASQLSLDIPPKMKRIKRNHVFIPINGVHQGTIRALQFAKTLSDDITAIHISIDALEEEKVKNKWDIWGDGYRLVILDSPYRLFIEPIIEFISQQQKILQQGDIITIIIPQFISQRSITNALHERTSELLRKVLLKKDEIIIVEVPYVVR